MTLAPPLSADGPLTIGVALPFHDQYTDYSYMLEFARAAERVGFDSVWLSDHIVGPTPGGANRWFEVTTLLAAIAAQVPRVRLATDVLVAAYRHPLHSAKALTTLDHISGGRLIVGVGSGYLENEFAALGIPLAKRAELTDECIRVWDTVWRGDDHPSFHGELYSFDDVVFAPHPLQRPRPPVLVGNASRAVQRRAGELADGWHPMALPLASVRDGARAVHAYAEQAGRESPPILSYAASFGTVGPTIDGPDRMPLTGGVEQVLADIDELLDIGVTNIVFRPGVASGTREQALEQLDVIAEQVMPKVR